MAAQNIDKPGTTAVQPVKMPTADDLTQRNLAGQTTIQMPALSVYTPDYGSLEASFNDILKSFDAYKQSAQASYGAQKSSLDTSLQEQLNAISTAKEDTREGYSQGRQQVAEDVFMTNRATERAMSARGLGGSGVEAMANIQNRMAAGESISDMANQYFDAQTQLVEAEQSARTNYDNSLQSLNASLQSTMAQIMSQEASSKMDYTQTIENLKRQVISDTNAMKQAQYEWTVAQEQLKQASSISNSMIQSVLSSALTDEEKIASLTDMGYTPTEANNLLGQTTASNNAKVLASIQQQINNYIALGYDEEEISSMVSGLVGSYPDLDISKLSLDGTPASTIGTVAGATQSTANNSMFNNYYDFVTRAPFGNENLSILSPSAIGRNLSEGALKSVSDSFAKSFGIKR